MIISFEAEGVADWGIEDFGRWSQETERLGNCYKTKEEKIKKYLIKENVITYARLRKVTT